MKYLVFIIPLFFLLSCSGEEQNHLEHFNRVHQVIWVVEDIENVIAGWQKLGFQEILDPVTLVATTESSDESFEVKVAKANLGGANITWIEPLEEESVFARFHAEYGDGAMSLVHHFDNKKMLSRELDRLSGLGIEILEEISISAQEGEMVYVLMDTQEDGTYILGYTYGDTDNRIFAGLETGNLHNMKINQYAFAIRDAGPVSEFWAGIGQPEFQINYPELGNMHYYGEPTDHELIQGWQRHGKVSYEWCIPVKPPIVYDDHIRAHGEGIHHLAFTVNDMDAVLHDYSSKGFVNSMGGTWGEEGKPGSGRYEYIGLEEAGGVTMELLWSYPSQ